MTVELPSGEFACRCRCHNRRLLQLQQSGRFLDGHHLLAHLPQGSVTDHKSVAGEMLAHGLADKLTLALAGCRDSLLQMPRILIWKPHKQRGRVRGHIHTISLDILTPMNIHEPTWDAEIDTGDGAMLRAVRLGEHAGSKRLAATLYELDPRTVVSPLHFHHANEELLFVLAGTPTLRTGITTIECEGLALSCWLEQNGKNVVRSLM